MLVLKLNHVGKMGHSSFESSSLLSVDEQSPFDMRLNHQKNLINLLLILWFPSNLYYEFPRNTFYFHNLIL